MPSRLPAGARRRAVRISFAQAMVGAIFSASTGGMFLIGYALKLGANNVQIGLMTTIPMLCVVAQLMTAAAVERGISRRGTTVCGAIANVLGWGLVILIPYAIPDSAPTTRIATLIGIITLVTLCAHVSGNARGSWVGDLIPSRFRGTFFGRMAMYAGIVATCFAVMEGGFLDWIKNFGVGAFSILFGFGMIFGLINALLFVPQHDVKLVRHEASEDFLRMARETFSNRPLMMVAIYATIWSLQGIAGPFYPTYMLRDLQMPFLGVGLVNAVLMVTFLLSGPFWGRVVDRFGCRPVIIACTLALAPLPFAWIWLTSPFRVYVVLSIMHLLVGFLIGGVNVSLNTLVYKVTPTAGRSVQFAIYSVLVVLMAAPMPTIGGHLPDWMSALGFPNDIRYTFYASSLFMILAVLAARKIQEPGAKPTSHMIRDISSRIMPDSRGP